MDISTYEVESEVEEKHWWFVVRRMLFERLIQEMDLPKDARILDVGTSTGTNLRLLKNMGFTNYQGLDFHEEAIKWCAQKQLGVVHKGDICAMPFAEGSFDLVLATDIIEHVDDDLKAVVEIRRVLVSGGKAIITVPAFQSLWGLQDEVSQHKRRYLKNPLKKLLLEAGFQVKFISYFNYLLFVPIWLARQLIKLSGIKFKSENQLNTPMINNALRWIFSLDVVSIKFLNPPFGVSILAIISR